MTDAPTIYLFDPTTDIFTVIGTADPSPLEKDVWLYPAHCTTTKPPDVAERQVAVFVKDAWAIVSDHRGETWFASDGKPVVIDVVGEPAPGLSSTAPVLPPILPSVPNNPTLGDWRVALTLWGKLDVVTASVTAMMDSSDAAKAMMGKVADQRLEYSNNVQRAELMQFKDAFGFTSDQIDESLWRAAQVAKGDLSGVWPLPAS